MKKHSIVLLSLLVLASPAVFGREPQRTREGEEVAVEGALPPEMKLTEFEEKKNTDIMNMLKKLVLAKREKEIAMLVQGLASASKAHDLHHTASDLKDHEYDAKAKQVIVELVGFLEMLSALRGLVVEGMKKNQYINMSSYDDERNKPFFLKTLDLESPDAQKEAFLNATLEQRREVIAMVAWLLTMLQTSMHKQVKAAIFPRVEALLAEQQQEVGA
ncbi:MAG: hypothetical protein QG604_407 [Candidatus Dependentiae bacterium]|nr:hypothetical protein [Candidatus Dependentiae bacterium]